MHQTEQQQPASRRGLIALVASAALLTAGVAGCSSSGQGQTQVDGAASPGYGCGHQLPLPSSALPNAAGLQMAVTGQQAEPDGGVIVTYTLSPKRASTIVIPESNTGEVFILQDGKIIAGARGGNPIAHTGTSLSGPVSPTHPFTGHAGLPGTNVCSGYTWAKIRGAAADYRVAVLINGDATLAGVASAPSTTSDTKWAATAAFAS